MTPHEYQLVTEQTGLYPEGGTGSLIAVNYCALGLGEAGETKANSRRFGAGINLFIKPRRKLLMNLGISFGTSFAWPQSAM
jgi:hypothetical protein